MVRMYLAYTSTSYSIIYRLANLVTYPLGMGGGHSLSSYTRLFLHAHAYEEAHALKIHILFCVTSSLFTLIYPFPVVSSGDAVLSGETVHYDGRLE